MVNSRIVAALLTAFVAVLPAQDKPVATDGAKGDEAKAVEATAPGRAPTIGVVDLDKAREQYPKAIAEREKLQKMAQSFKEQMVALEKRVDEIRAAQSLLKEGTDEWELKEAERGVVMQQSKIFSQLFKSQFERAREKSDLMIYQDFKAAIAQVAKDRGVQLVLRMHEGPEVEKGKETADSQLELYSYNRRNVWFAADEVDLTPALIKYLSVPLDPSKSAPQKPEAPAAAKATGNGQK